MPNGFHTIEAAIIFEALKPQIQFICRAVESFRCNDVKEILGKIRANLSDARISGQTGSELFLADIFVMERYADLLAAYCDLWDKILREQFSESWSTLQDALDALRMIKKFSTVEISFYEDQLLELEQLYPYKIFLSIGMIVSYFECSLCGHNIDSVDCPHVFGQLYRGKMAVGVAKDIVAIDHAAFVENPQDKRCVVSYENASEQFALVRYLATLLRSGECSPFRFARVEFTTKKICNPEYVRLGRNETCYCDSGKKFKNCCIGKEIVDKGHVNIIARPHVCPPEPRMVGTSKL